VTPGFGIVALDGRLSFDWSTEIGTDGVTYSQAGPGPGHPIRSEASSEWLPFAAGAQTAGVQLRTIRAGYPGRDGASVAARLESETALTDWRGWDEPVLVADAWEVDGAESVGYAQVTRLPDTDELVISTTAGGLTNGEIWVFNPRTEEFRGPYDWSAEEDSAGQPYAAVWDPESSRMTWLVGAGSVAAGDRAGYVAYRADERVFDPANGSLRIMSVGWPSEEITTAAGTPDSLDRLSIAAKRGANWLAFWRVEDQDVTLQMQSSDRGATWQLVESIADSVADQFRVVATDTGFAVAYIDTGASNQARCRLLSTAGALWSEASGVDIVTLGCSHVHVDVDGDGVLYALAMDDTDFCRWLVSRSLDGGASWDQYESSALPDTSEAWPSLLPQVDDICCANGAVYAVVATTPRVGVIRLGGWTNVEHAGRLDRAASRLDRFGWGGLGTGGEAYIRVIDANLLNWDWTFTTSPSDYWTSPTSSLIRTAGWGKVTYQSGGEADSGVSTGFEWGCLEQAGGFSVLLQILMGSNGFRVINGDADGLFATVDSLDLSVTPSISFRVHMEGLGTGNGALCSVWYRVEGADKWTAVFTDETLSSADAEITTTYARFGELATPTRTESYVFEAMTIAQGAWNYGVQNPAAIFEASDDGVRGLSYGKALPADRPYPLPILTAAAEAEPSGGIQGQGYTRATEIVTLPVRYEYGVHNILPTDAPSPRDGWRSTDDSEARFAWDWLDYGDNEAAHNIGEVIGFYVQSANPAVWVVEHNSSGSWETTGTLDLRLGTGLSFVRNGATIRPTAGTVIDRYIHEGELVGGYVSDGSNAARITRNTGGYWNPSGDSKRIRIDVATDGGALAASATETAELVAPGGVVLLALPGIPRRIRFGAAASQVTPYGDYRLGSAGIGRVIGVGADPGWGWRREALLTREISRRADQSMDVRVLGPPRTRLTYEWPDGVIMRDLRSRSAGDYEAVEVPSTGEVIGMREDAYSSMTGALISILDQGRVPCLVIPRLPALGTTITDPYLWLYGRITSESHGITGLYGDEGDDEVVRVDGLSFEEIA